MMCIENPIGEAYMYGLFIQFKTKAKSSLSPFA